MDKKLIEKIIWGYYNFCMDNCDGNVSEEYISVVAEQLANPIEPLVRQGVSQPVETADTDRPKKYLIFAFDSYRALGGLNDLIEKDFDDLNEARKYADCLGEDNTQIVDRDTWNFY